MFQEKNGYNIYVLKIKENSSLEEISNNFSINMTKIIVEHLVYKK